jgi:hypothetical protein
MMRPLTLVLIGVTRFALAVPVTNTEQFDLPAGGVLHLENSVGELTVEGWDRPDVEMITTKFAKSEYSGPASEASSRILDQVKVSSARQGDELVLKTAFPKHPGWQRLFRGETDFELTYVIRAPRNARLVIDHEIGEVHVENMTGDVQVTDHMGEITVHLPEEGHYSIDAKSTLGSVTSDFPGHQERKHWLGSQFSGDTAPAAQKLNLRMGSGDIIILKERKPPYPGPLPQ